MDCPPFIYGEEATGEALKISLTARTARMSLPTFSSKDGWKSWLDNFGASAQHETQQGKIFGTVG